MDSHNVEIQINCE